MPYRQDGSEYWVLHDHTSALVAPLDAFKTFTMGCFQSSVRGFRKDITAKLSRVEYRVMSLELAYTQIQDPSTSSSLLITLREVMLFHTTTTKT